MRSIWRDRVRWLVAVAALAAPVAPGAAAIAVAADVRVLYEAPHVTLEAREAPLGDVLRALGRRAGFVVEGTPDPAARVTATLAGVGLEEALRQVLRGVSHALVYDPPGTGRGLTAVVLTGASGRTEASSVTAWPAPAAPRLAPGMDEGLRLAADALAVATEGVGEPPATVQALLAAHALSGAPPQAAPSSAPGAVQGALAGGVTGSPEGAAPPASDASLAALTRRAQSQLNALVQGLATATSSLAGASTPPPGESQRAATPGGR